MESCLITPLSLTVHQLDLLIPWESQYWNRYELHVNKYNSLIIIIIKILGS